MVPPSSILVIDDDKLVCWSMSVALGRAGYRINEAATGAEGLAAVQGNFSLTSGNEEGDTLAL